MSKRPHPIPDSEKKQPAPTPDSAKKKSRLDREISILGLGGTGGRNRSVLYEEPKWSTYDGTKNIQMIIPEGKPTDAAPQPTRSIIVNRDVKDLVENNAVCRYCQQSLTLSFENTVGIATIPKLVCTGDDCQLEAEASAERTTSFREGKVRRLVEFSVNVQYVLSLMSSGDGGTEAAKLLGFLNLPNATTMGSGTFKRVEEELDGVIIEVTERLLDRQVYKEVKEATKDDPSFDYEAWEAATKNPDAVDYPMNKRPRLTVTMDGAWNQRSAGRSYNSKSGFAILVGTCTWQPIAFSLRSTFCRTCSHCSHRNGEENLDSHECEINHEGSAGAMESASLLSMYHHLYDRYLIVLEFIVTDDDTTMSARCKWSNVDFKRHYGRDPIVPITKGPRKGQPHVRPDRGLLRYPIPEPKFLADPAHRKKTFRNKLYSIKTKNNKLHEVDIIRLTRNFAYMSRQLKGMHKDKWLAAGKAVLDHHFDVHDGCGDFCRRKKELKQGIQNDKKIYRSMVGDKTLYQQLCPVVEQFISMDRLEEIGHGYHTNVNESFNNTVSWLAPKNKVYSGSQSLRARLSIALGIKLDGFAMFFRKLYQEMGIAMEPGTWHYFAWVGRWKEEHKARTETTEYKRRRQEKTNAKIKAYVEQLRRARQENDLYQTGIRMEQEPNAVTPIVSRAIARKPCKCGSLDHQRTSHKNCPLNSINMMKNKQAECNDEDEQDALDELDVNDDEEDVAETCAKIIEADKEEDDNKEGGDDEHE